MLIAFIILNILGIAAFLVALCTDEDDIALFMSCVCFIIGFICYVSNNTPTAMDVYQNKTTLEITYRDGVAVDSVVIFKDKNK